MALFNWGNRDANTVDSHAANPGGEAAVSPNQSSSAPAQGGVSANTRAAAGAAAREEIKRRRGRPPNAGNAAVTDSALQEQVNARIAEQLDSLHAPELWEAMLCLPADGMLAMTGKERWNLGQKERKTMGLSGSALARTMMITNPRALAAFMFISIMSTAYLPRALAEMKEFADKKKAKEKESPDAVAKS